MICPFLWDEGWFYEGLTLIEPSDTTDTLSLFRHNPLVLFLNETKCDSQVSYLDAALGCYGFHVHHRNSVL